MIYTFNENQCLNMYSIINVIDSDRFACNEQGKFEVKFNLTPEYKWSDVGVYKAGPISEEVVIIDEKNISGKVIKVKEYLITCPLNVLHEQ